MINIDGTLEDLQQIGEKRSYIITNEVYNFNEFWMYGIGCTVILGFVFYNYKYLSALSPKKEAK